MSINKLILVFKLAKYHEKLVYRSLLLNELPHNQIWQLVKKASFTI